MEGAIREDVEHLAERLASRGFSTLAVVNSMLLQRDGLQRGFERLLYVPYVQGERRSSRVTAPAIEMLRGRDRGRPFFAFVHYMDVHSDYVSLPRYEAMFARPYRGFADGSTQQLYRHALGLVDFDRRDAEHLLDLYDAGIRQVDDELAALIDHLREEGLLRDSLLVVLSDHGEEFLEHGGVLHGHSQFQEVVRVPLLLRGPGLPAGRRVAAPVSLVDVVPTALALLGLPAPERLDGMPVHGAWAEPPEPLPGRLLYFEADVVFPPPRPGLSPVGPYRAVRDGRFKLHLDTRNGNVGLFDLARDPGETVNAIADHPDAGRRLWVRLQEFLGEARAGEPGRADAR